MERAPREFAVATGRGAAVSVRDYSGAGPGVLLLHGAGLNVELWDPVVALLKDDFRVVALDFLGHGESSLPSVYSLHADLAAVEAVIETLGLDRPAIVGHSYGGILGVEYAATHPECPVVINLDGLGGQGRADHYPGLAAQEVEDYWSGRLAFVDGAVPRDDSGDGLWREQQVQALLAEAGTTEDPVAAMVSRGFQEAVGGSWERRPTRGFLLALLNTLFQLDVFSAYHRARCPVVAVVATRSRDSEVAFARFLDAYHAGLDSATASNALVRRAFVDCGHAVPLERPEWVADLVRDSLADRSTQSPAASAL